MSPPNALVGGPDINALDARQKHSGMTVKERLVMIVNSSSHSQMVGIYTRLFGLLSVITLAGIAAVYFFHIPVWVAVIVGLVLIAVKGAIVVESFKQFMVGRNIIVMIFALTGILVLGLVLLPLLNRSDLLVGTRDISKEEGG